MTPSYLALCALCFLLTTEKKCALLELDCPDEGHHEPGDTESDLEDHHGGGSNKSGSSSLDGCDFEEGLCTFSHSNDAPTTWMRGTGLSATGPCCDHMGQRTGHYLSLLGQNGTRPLAALRSAILLPTNSCEMSFYCHFGQVSGALQVLTQTHTGGPLQQVWSWLQLGSEPPEEALWVRTTVPLNSTQMFQAELIDGSNTSKRSVGLP